MSVKANKIITSEPDSLGAYFSKIWKYRMLILSFSKREIKAKYAQTLLGLIWTLLQPITGIIIFTFFFEHILKIEQSDYPYPLFALIGFTSWNLWAYIFQQGSTSIFEQRNLLSKVYFPKVILPLSKVLTGSFDFLISFILLLVLIPFFKVAITWKIIILPFFFLLQIVFAVSCAIILAVISINKRDFFHIIPYISNFGIWLTPVFYSIQLFPEKWRFIFQYNPIALCIEGYRWCIFNNYTLNQSLFLSLPIIVILFLVSIILIKKNDDLFVDQL